MSASIDDNNEAISFARPAFQRNERFEAYDRLRNTAPVYHDPVTNHFVLTRYADIRSALINHKVFSNDAGFVGQRASPVRDQVEKIFLEKGPLHSRNLQTYDPPEHKAHRAPVDRAFDHWNVKALRGYIEGQAISFVDLVADAGKMEFVDDFAIPFPLRVFGNQLGIPNEDAAKLKLWADVAVEEINPVLTPDREIEIAHILAGMNEYFQNAIAAARQNPDDRLISKLTQTTDSSGSFLDVAELLSVLRAIVVAAGDTTTFALAGGMKLLVDHPQIAETIRSDEKSLDRFVEETLRLVSPVQTLFRRTREEIVLGGVSIPKGSIVEVRYGAGNLDPEHFGCPRALDLSRANVGSHLAFGVGAHSCLGMQLARAEMQIGFKVLVNRLANFRLARGERSFEFSGSYIASGPVRAFIAFDRR
jgi:cytochrome P450